MLARNVEATEKRAPYVDFCLHQPTLHRLHPTLPGDQFINPRILIHEVGRAGGNGS